MEFILAVSLLTQQTPGEALQKFCEAIEKKDFTSAKEAFEGPMTEKDFQKFLTEMEEPSRKGYLEGVKKAPSISAPAEGVKELQVEWRWISGGVLMKAEAEFVPGEKGWKVKDYDHDIRKEGKTKGVAGASKSTPSEVLQAFITAIEKKDYGNVAALWVEKERRELTAEEVKNEAEREAKRYAGWLEALKKLCILGAADDSVTEIEWGIEFTDSESEVGVGVALIKESGEWKLQDLDIDVEKEK